MKSHSADDDGLALPHVYVDEAMAQPPAGDGTPQIEPELIISSDITADFPIGPAELEAIETYFGQLLDLVLSGNKTDAATLPRHKLVR